MFFSRQLHQSPIRSSVAGATESLFENEARRRQKRKSFSQICSPHCGLAAQLSQLEVFFFSFLISQPFDLRPFISFAFFAIGPSLRASKQASPEQASQQPASPARLQSRAEAGARTGAAKRHPPPAENLPGHLRSPHPFIPPLPSPVPCCRGCCRENSSFSFRSLFRIPCPN